MAEMADCNDDILRIKHIGHSISRLVEKIYK